MNNQSNKPKIGISGCLLGEKVRYDGGHFMDKWIANQLSKYVDFHPICPEMMMGLGSPREILRVTHDPETGERRLIETKSKIDHTKSIHKASKKIISNLPVLDGFILARKSPSCGVITAKHYNAKTGYADERGAGLFSAKLLENDYQFPIIDSGLLFENDYKDLFMRQVFAHFELRNLERKTSKLQAFHAAYKYLLMEHQPAKLKELGQIASQTKNIDEQFDEYSNLFMKTIKENRPNKKKRINVYQHLLGYFKKDLTSKEKENLLKKMDGYRDHRISYQTLLELVDFLVDGHIDHSSKAYLKTQKIFEPYPKELSPYKF